MMASIKGLQTLALVSDMAAHRRVESAHNPAQADQARHAISLNSLVLGLTPSCSLLCPMPKASVLATAKSSEAGQKRTMQSDLLDLSCSLNSIQGGYLGDYIGDYYEAS